MNNSQKMKILKATQGGPGNRIMRPKYKCKLPVSLLIAYEELLNAALNRKDLFQAMLQIKPGVNLRVIVCPENYGLVDTNGRRTIHCNDAVESNREVPV